MTLATLAEAIEWAEARWLERPVPLRITVHDTEGELGGLRYAPAFEHYLGGRPDDTIHLDVQEPCYHVGLPIGTSLFTCRCAGTGMQTVRRERYKTPMWRAMARIEHAKPTRPHLPSPAQLVALLVAAGWNAHRAARLANLPWDMAEALFLMALRKLHGQYQEGPISLRRRIGWVDLSDSQRAAMSAGEAA